MPVGRKPKPTHLRLIGGNAGHRPINRREPKPLPALPKPPAFLCDDAKEEWAYVSEQLYRVGLLSGIDRASLAAYCQAYGRWAMAERALAEMGATDQLTHGLVIRTSNGNSIQNPLVGTANKAHADMVRYAVEFGMTPSARTRIQAEAPLDAVKDEPKNKYF